MVSKQALSGRYILRDRIASGGQASVWSAYDRRLGRIVAVKVVSQEPASRPGAVERLRREAIAAAGLLHPNIAQVFDSGRDDGVYYIVMELLEGGSLRELEQVRPLDQTEAAVVGQAVARALSHAHSKGILHRDVKPSNVLLTQSGFPKLADFGIARSMDAFSAELTSDGELIGTLSYMAPEQISGEGATATEATDIYCLGLTLYEALTGENPRAGKGLADLAARASHPVPPISTRVAELDPEIAQLIDLCLSPDQSSRPQSASQIAEILSAHCIGRTELDLRAFAASGEETSTSRPTPRSSHRSTPPARSEIAPDAATTVPPETQSPPRLPPIGSLLRAASLLSLPRLAAAVAVSATFAWVGYQLGIELAASLARLLPSGIPFVGS